MAYDLVNPGLDLVIFEVDNPSLHSHAKLLRILDTKRAEGRLQHPVEIGMGEYFGERNVCFVMAAEDFNANRAAIDWLIEGQESILEIKHREGQPAAAGLVYLQPDAEGWQKVVGLGEMRKVACQSEVAAGGSTTIESGIYTAG